jgi:hypothetical protein
MKQISKCLCLLTLSATILVACKKEVSPETSGTRSSSAAIGEPDYYSEEDLSEFVSDIIFYAVNTTDEHFLDPVTAINKMEATLNYTMSDLDTAFDDYDTALTYTFSLTPNLDGNYNMPEIAEEMYNIKSVVLGRMDDNVGYGLSPRMMAASIEPALALDQYTVTLLFGKAISTDDRPLFEPLPTHVANGSYIWENANRATSCIENTAALIGESGREWFLKMSNYQYTTWASTSGKIPYFDGIFKFANTKTIGGDPKVVEFVDYSDVTSLGSGLPTSMSNTPTTVNGIANRATLSKRNVRKGA